MDYQKHYALLMSRTLGRVKGERYYEEHHVIPRCMGGSNAKSNLVLLTAEEHYVAHQLLVKMNPTHRGLIYAANSLTAGSTQTIRNNKLYGWIKKKFQERNCKENHPMFGKNHSEESRKKMSVSRSGDKNPMFGITHDAQARIKISKAHKGRVITDTWKKRISEGTKGAKNHRFGVKMSEESKQKMRATVLAKKGEIE